MTNQTQFDQPPHIRVLNALIAPILVAAILSTVINTLAINIPSLKPLATGNGAILMGLGITSLILGQRWYGWEGLSFRRGRPMMAGVGFAFLAWISLLIARIVSIPIREDWPEPNLGITFLFLLIFEAFCVQLWTFGLIFRAVADWRQPLSATLLSGAIFGMAGWLLFQESFPTRLAIVYFVVWGFMYAIIRLRTGSFVGIAIIQAMQSLTAWHLLPIDGLEGGSLTWLYGLSIALYALITWRLLPKLTSDFRV